MKILGTRTIAWIYPHLSFEAMVWDEEKQRAYFVNMDVNDEEKPEVVLDDSWWAYSIPIDSAVYNISDYYVSDVDFTEVLREMVRRWNANPVFENGSYWMN